jgi:exodeoxyribonuclease III
MKILTWNIRHGGAVGLIDNIYQSLKNHNSDIIVLTEYRMKKDDLLSDFLKKSGWSYQESSTTQNDSNGILIASKIPFKKKECRNNRWLEVYFPDCGLSLLGVHIPGIHDKHYNKEKFWDTVLEYALKNDPNSNSMIIGDFNTGLANDAEGASFKLSKKMEDLIKYKWVDAWRHLHKNDREYTWYSHAKNGFRLDYAFLNNTLCEKLVNAEISHKEREEKLSDHSPMFIELNL